MFSIEENTNRVAREIMADAINIDGHKLTQHPIEVARWLQGGSQWETAKTLYPIYVEISPFGGCNFRCSFCAKDFLEYKNTRIERDVLLRCIETMAKKGVKSIYFAGEGEPLLYKGLGEILEFGSSQGLDVALNTNCSISDKDSLRSAVKNCKWIRASVNAGNAKEHSEIHHCREDVFDRVLANLQYCVQVKRELGSGCVIGAQAVLLDSNRDSMISLAKACREVGIDYLVIKPYSQHPESITHQHEGTEYGNVGELAARLEEEQAPGFKVYFRRDSFDRAQKNALAYSACYSVPSFWAYIRSNGDVSGCNSFLLDERFRYGNLNEKSFDEIWEGDGRRANFEYMKTHDIKRCRVNCRMDKANEYLWGLKNPSPHVNFI